MTKKLSQHTYFIASGKGGVGKSTVAVNLAVSVAKLGYQVGLFDADVYGPSIPIMTGLRRVSPNVRVDFEGKKFIVPFHKFGVHILSIGFFVEEAESVLWRGPMLHGILHKMIHGTEWPELDFLFIDLPPGTGDIPISLKQLLNVDGAVIVCTPQEVAVLDAAKAIHSLDQLQIPILGLIENMAGFAIPGTEQIYPIFGEGKAKQLAEKCSISFLGDIPLILAIREGGDQGYPSAYHQGQNDVGKYFCQIAHKFFGL